jgi:dipeptidyl aminopeptidase/acylaminoacyl peptidase|tara:strand:+ start:131 stop:1987 length:1857 start_codon:yes stop_codon:yes gene_type:complete
MKTKFLPIIILLIGCSNTHKEYTIQEFMDITSFGGSSFSHDEKSILIRSNESGVYNAYEIDLKTHDLKQLTFSDSNSISPISYFPNDKRFLFRSDQGGNEILHIYLNNLDGSTVDLTPGVKSRSLFLNWANDKKSFFFTSSKRNPKYMDLYEMDIDSFKSKLIFKNDDALNIGDISKNKRYLALSKTYTRDNSDLYIYNFDNQNLKKVLFEETDVNHSPARFSLDSKTIYYVTDLDSEFRYLKKYNIETGKVELVQKENWDIVANYFSESGKYRITTINKDSQTEIKILNTINGKYLKLPKMPSGNISSINISKSESLMSFYHGGAQSPGDLYYYKIGSRKPSRLTSSMNPLIDQKHLGKAKIVRFNSLDGLEIPAIYYKPPQANRNNKVPALVKVHGGPGGQARVGYRASTQFLVNNGYAVLDINNRGSSGYGKTFQTLDDQAHGKGDLDDCVAAIDWLKNQNHIDGENIGILGGSYGGYMVMAAMAFRPDAFDVGVNIFGVTNWIRTLKSIPPWWEAARESLYKELGNPFTQEDYLYSISPLFHAENIKKPVLILQGANDPRVLQVESDEMVDAIKKQNVPVEYVVFPDEGHGFSKKKNQITSNETILTFLDKYLK